jgi:rhodanese-related sulfurtransferase/DNA-binding MarR family transcriptional regulator
VDPTTKRQFKTELFEQFARIGKALAAPQRLELLELLSQGEKPVEELSGAIGVPIANASQHLQVLRRAELVSIRRQGSHIYYRLSDSAVFRLWQALRELGEMRLAEIDRVVGTYLSDRTSLQAMSAAELSAKLAEGGVTVLDVRPEAEYAAAHITGARSIPIEELETRLHEIPATAPIVAYCRGPYCVFADEAVRLLKSRGFAAARLEVGLPDWAAQGLPIEKIAA